MNTESTQGTHRPPRITAALLVLIGAVLACGGGYLLSLGGSAYYAVAGIAVVAAAVLYWRGNAWGERIYALMLLGTLAWAWGESGSNPWALGARTFAPAVLGLWLATPWVRHGLRGASRALWRSEAGATAVLMLVVIGFVFSRFNEILVPAPSATDEAGDQSALAASNDDWPNYGNGITGQRFSPLTQIGPDNVTDLKVAWVHRSGDIVPNGMNEATPIKVGELLYTCTPRGVVIAIDAKTGIERWRFDPMVNAEKYPVALCRGVSYFQQPDRTGACAARILSSSFDGKLHARDALDGKPCADFGTDGAISLLEGMGEVKPGHWFNTSPATIVAGHAVIGAAVVDNQSTDVPSGAVRSFDPVTGALQWAWDMGAPDRLGAPGPGEVYTRSTPNAWPSFAADETLGLVYVPTGNPSPDFYGAQRRPFDEQYGSSLVALELTNGRPRWSYQTTHHDIWDYDLPAQPVLMDVPGPDGMTPAVVLPTKRGDVFVLDRRDGRPIIPAPEREVPGGAMPGEALSKTQPVSDLILPASLISEATMWGATPIDMMMCRITFRQSRYEGLFTPPGLQRTLQFPGSFGTINWGSVSVNDDNKTLVVNSAEFLWTVHLVPREKHKDPNPQQPQLGTPYVVDTERWLGLLRVPCHQPPWGFLTTFDLKTGKVLWRRLVGTARDNSGPRGINFGPPLPIGVPGFGGTVTTRGGLVFMAATLDRYLRAFDLKSGKELWRTRLPAGGQATPMTYMADGKQYVVITAGGHYILGTKQGDYTIAYALPDAK